MHPGLNIAHDGRCGALLGVVADALAKEGAPDVSTFDELHGSDLGPERDWLLLFDVRQIDAAIDVQTMLRERGRNVLALGTEPGAFWLGPYVSDAPFGCLACLKIWLSKNLDSHHWSVSPRLEPSGRVSAVDFPLAPAAKSLLETWLQEAHRSLATDDTAAGLQGATVRLDCGRFATQRHGFFAYPNCAHCADLPLDTAANARIRLESRLRDRDSDSRLANPSLTVDRVRRLCVDRHTGLIKHVFQNVSSDLMPLYTAEMPMVEGAGEAGYGRSDSREKSELIAMLEVLERFCGHKPRRTKTQVRGSYREISAKYPEACTDPRRFVLHAPEQYSEPGFDFKPYSDDLEFDWSWGHSLRRGEPVLVPQQLGYYWLTDTERGPVNRFVYDTSNGCAMGASLEEAILFGLCEVIERDAYLTTWYTRLAPRLIDPESILEPRSRALIARAHAHDLRVHLFDMRHEIDVPLVWGMVVDPKDDAPVKSYCASAAHGCWSEAVFSALVEVTTSIGVYQRSMPQHREKARAMWLDSTQVRQMSDHVLLYSLPETVERFDFLWSGDSTTLAECERSCPSRRQRDVTRELLDLVNRVLAVADDVIVVDQTFREMSSLGLHCVKVLAPGLLPVTFGHQYRRVSLARLQSAVRHHKGPDAIFGADDVNPYPHNFP